MSELAGKGSKYTDDQRIEAAVQYASKGTFKAVEKVTGIARRTLSDWSKQEWWHEQTLLVRQQNEELYRARYAEILEKATAITLEKLPDASAKDAMVIAGIANDKLRLSLNLPTSNPGNGGISAVTRLADEFRNLAQSFIEKQAKDAQAIEGELSD